MRIQYRIRCGHPLKMDEGRRPPRRTGCGTLVRSPSDCPSAVASRERDTWSGSAPSPLSAERAGPGLGFSRLGRPATAQTKALLSRAKVAMENRPIRCRGAGPSGHPRRRMQRPDTLPSALLSAMPAGAVADQRIIGGSGHNSGGAERIPIAATQGGRWLDPRRDRSGRLDRSGHCHERGQADVDPALPILVGALCPGHHRRARQQDGLVLTGPARSLPPPSVQL